ASTISLAARGGASRRLSLPAPRAASPARRAIHGGHAQPARPIPNANGMIAMLIQLQAIERARAAARSRLRLISVLRSSFAVCVATALLAAPCAALARTQTPAQPQTQPPQTQTQA